MSARWDKGLADMIGPNLYGWSAPKAWGGLRLFAGAAGKG